MPLESDFQARLIDELEELFPGCLVLKNDPNYRQGIPDLLILYGDKWAALETKRAPNSSRRNNQEYYVDYLNKMSYSAFIDQANKEHILDELQQTFRSKRTTRISKRVKVSLD